MVTPAQAADKFATGWINAKPRAIAGYSAVAGDIAARAIAKQAELLANFQARVNDGTWANRLRARATGEKLIPAYTQKLNSIDSLTDVEKLKVQNSVALKQYLKSQLAAVLAIFKAAAVGERTVPPGLSDVGLNMMLMAGVIHEEDSLGLASTAQQIYDTVDDYMGTNFGWPNKA